MAYSFNTYISDGTDIAYNVAFPYIYTSDVKGYVNGVEKAFTWVTSSTIKFTEVPANGSYILIKRITTRDSRLINFQDASTLQEEYLNTDSKQGFYLSQEAFDAVDSCLALNNAGSYDALSKRIVNGVTPVSNTDVAIKSYVDGLIAGAIADNIANAAAAQDSASQAATNATLAGSYASAANTSASSAATNAATILARFNEFVSVTDYGAKGNGTTDDTTAIKNAITSNPGRAIFFPTGNYLISSPLIIGTDNTILVGTGRDLSCIVRSSDFSPNFYGNNTIVFANPTNLVQEEGGVVGSGRLQSCGIIGLGIKSTTEMTVVGAHVFVMRVQNGLFNDLILRNGFQAMHFKGGINCFVENVTVQADTSIMTTTQSNATAAFVFSFNRGSFGNNTCFLNHVFVQSTFPLTSSSGYYSNLVVEACDGLWVANSYFGCAVGQNVYINPRVSSATSEVGRTYNKVMGLKATNVWLDNATGIVFANSNTSGYTRHVTFTNLTIYGAIGRGTYGIVFNGDNTEDISIDHARIWDLGNKGILISKGKYINLNDVVIRQCNLNNTAYTPCVLINDTNTAGAVTHFKITECSFGWNLDGSTANTSRGIVIGTGCDYYTIKDNDLTGNSSTLGFYDSSSGASLNHKISDNLGFKTENSGYIQFSSGITSIVITHGLDVTPLAGDINITFLGNPGTVGAQYITSIGSTTFTLNLSVAPTSNIGVRWKVNATQNP